MTPLTPSPVADSADPYQPFIAAMTAELAARAAADQPLRINIWDAQHGSMVPRELAFHPALRAAVASHGAPAYVIELTDAPWLEKDFDQHRTGTLRDQRAIESKITLNGKFKPEVRAMLVMALEASREGAHTIFPDPRSQQKDTPRMSRQEQQQVSNAFSYFKAVSAECSDVVVRAYRASLSPDERAALESAERKTVIGMSGGHGDGKHIDTTKVDRIIGDRVINRFPFQAAKGSVIPITIYGAGHFLKSEDINEHLPGIDVAVFDSPDMSARLIRQVHGARDLPAYVWYIDEQRLVKLDHDAAKLELLGLPDAATLREWEKTGFVALESPPDFPDELKHQCRRWLRDLPPYQGTQGQEADDAPQPAAPHGRPLKWDEIAPGSRG